MVSRWPLRSVHTFSLGLLSSRFLKRAASLPRPSLTARQPSAPSTCSALCTPSLEIPLSKINNLLVAQTQLTSSYLSPSLSSIWLADLGLLPKRVPLVPHRWPLCPPYPLWAVSPGSLLLLLSPALS